MGGRNCDYAMTGELLYGCLCQMDSTVYINPAHQSCGRGFGALYGHVESSLGTAISVLRNLHLCAVAAESYRMGISSH
jgi:hypothetical protein